MRRGATALILAVVLPASLAPAQSVAPPARHGRSIPGTPLDTFMSTHLTTEVPPAKDFVRASRPDPSTLDYTPVTGAVPPDPERPPLRDTANLEALQAELEQGLVANERKARGLGRKAAAKR